MVHCSHKCRPVKFGRLPNDIRLEGDPLAKRTDKKDTTAGSGATVGYEAQLWQMADALRGSMDAAEYKHVVLGLIFLKYISDAFEEQHSKLVAEKAKGADPEGPDEYRAQNIFWVPPEARLVHLKAQAKQSTIGRIVADAMTCIDGQIANGDTFDDDRHPDLKAEFILANPPFNMKEWNAGVKDNDTRWQYGIPPASNAHTLPLGR